MQIDYLTWSATAGWSDTAQVSSADLVLYFGARATLERNGWFDQLAERYPGAEIAGCSSASQISGGMICEQGIAGVALKFSRAGVRTASVVANGSSLACGRELGRQLAAPDLAGIFVLSDGLGVNGSDLTRGISSAVGTKVPVSGGLAADGNLFTQTLVGLNGQPRQGLIAAIGFYGEGITLSTGSAGGWAEFGPRREITASDGNVLMALDGKPAFELYERYLGPEDLAALPGSALLFPLKVFDPLHPEHSVVRTVLSIDEGSGAMTFAGNMPKGWMAQLMRGNVDRLTTGAAEAARQIASDSRALTRESLVLMVSCIGRQMLMGQRCVDEVDAVSEIIGTAPVRLGFYSYGEICPHEISGRGEMHNQTMTITAISEAA